MKRLFQCACLLMLAYAPLGCALTEKLSKKKKKPSPPPAVAVKQQPTQVGTVAMINENLKFVLVDVFLNQMPEKGTRLQCVRDGVETATLTVGPESKRPFIAADLISGLPTKGDLVIKPVE